MITLRISTDVNDDRRVVLTLPPEVPTGRADLVVTIESLGAEREKGRADARDQFLALARSSAFCSAGPYPSRDEPG